MIAYLHHFQIDKNKWDDCIDSSLNRNIYGCSWYLDACCGQWDALIEDDYTSVMPLPVRRKWGIDYLFLPSVVQQLGIFSPAKICPEKVDAFIRSIPKKFRYGQLNFNHSNPIDDVNIKAKKHINLELPLNKPYDELFKNYSDNIKRNLKKCPAEKINIIKNGSIENLIGLFQKHQPKQIQKLPSDYYDVLRKISTVLHSKSQASVWEVYFDEVLCAGILFAFGFNKCIFLFSVANTSAKENALMPHLIDSFIGEHAGSKIVLDFEGSDHPSLYRFYKSFGAVEQNYHQIKINKLPWPVNLFA